MIMHLNVHKSKHLFWSTLKHLHGLRLKKTYMIIYLSTSRCSQFEIPIMFYIKTPTRSCLQTPRNMFPHQIRPSWSPGFWGLPNLAGGPLSHSGHVRWRLATEIGWDPFCWLQFKKDVIRDMYLIECCRYYIVCY